MSKQIQLSQGKYAIVDDEDFEYLNQWKWCINTHGYAVRTQNIRINPSKRIARIIKMHQVIMPPSESRQIDHINNNKLDNRKCNLRECTIQENQRNKSKPKNNTSGFKGVEKRKNRYRAALRVDGVRIYFGTFDCPIKAAKAYNEAAIKYFGKFANLNEIPAQ